VQYENLVQNPEKEMRDLCDFIGIEFQSVMLDTSNPELPSQRLDRKKNPWNAGEEKAKKIDSSKVDAWKDVLTSYEADLIGLNFSNHKALSKLYSIDFKRSLDYFLNHAIRRLGQSNKYSAS
jgi:hypothetical protein